MNYYQRFSINKKIKSLFLSTILVSLTSSYFNSIKALEFQWNPNSGFKALRWYQRTPEKNFKNKIFLFFRPSDRKTGLLSLNIKYPDKFNSTLKPKNISLCKAKMGGYTAKTKCIQDIPSEIVLNKDTQRLEIFPTSPLPSDKNTYAVVFKINNPRKSGLYQFHSFGKSSGPVPVSSYIGSWTITIGP